MPDQVPTLPYAPATRKRKTASRLLAWGSILLLVSLLIAGLLPSRNGTRPTTWAKIGLYAMAACFVAGFLLDVAGVIHVIVRKR